MFFVVFQGSRLVFRGFRWVLLVIQGSRVVFTVPGWFYGFSRFQAGFSWFQVGFHGSRPVFMIFHGSRPVFMVFHGSRPVFHGFLWCQKSYTIFTIST